MDDTKPRIRLRPTADGDRNGAGRHGDRHHVVIIGVVIIVIGANVGADVGNRRLWWL